MPEGVRWHEYQTGRDPREDEAWFLELPVAERERLRARWEQETVRFEPWRQVQKCELRHALVTTILLLGVAASLPSIAIGALGTTLLLLPVAGGLAGFALFHFGRTRFDYAAIGGGAYLLLLTPAMLRAIFGMGQIGGAISMLLFCGGLALAVSGFAYLGLRREMRATPGSE